MTKRLSKFEKDDWINDSVASLRKKIKIENDYILERTEKIRNKKPKEIDITKHEVQKFLLILQLLLDKAQEKEINNCDESDGAGDIVLTIVKELFFIIANNSKELKIPKFLSKALKILKSIFDNAKSEDATRECSAEEELEEPSGEANSDGQSGCSETPEE